MLQFLSAAILIAFSFQLFSATRAHGVLARTWHGFSKEMLYGAVVSLPNAEIAPYWDTVKARAIVEDYFSTSFEGYGVTWESLVSGDGLEEARPSELTISLEARMSGIPLLYDERTFRIQEGEKA